MAFRILGFLLFAALVSAQSLFFTTSPTRADSHLVWSFSEGNDASNRGRMTARLRYGVPETDNVQVDGVCEARGSTSVMSANLILGADVGKLADGANVNVRFTGGGFNHFVSGSVYGTKIEEGITGISLDVNVNDRLWKALSENDSLDYLVPGYSASKLALKDGHGKIRQFISACRTYAEVLDPKKTTQTSPALQKSAQYQTASGPQEPAAPSGGVSEKEAYEAAKELGTLEAWEAFLNNFSKGFRADLARAYLKRLGASSPTTKTSPPPPPAPKITKVPPPPPPGPMDISISQTANQAACKGGDSCSYTVVATNTGGTAFAGQLVIANSLAPRGATLISTGNAPWFCQGMGGGAVCTNPAANIAPGASTTLSLTFKLPRGAGSSVTSCASVSWGGAPSGSSVRDVQQALNQRGFNVGRPDGKAGRKTVNSIRQFQSQNGLRATGEIDLPFLITLLTQRSAGDANQANDQACAGSAVFNAPAPSATFNPRPKATYCADGRLRKRGRCVCPAVVPIWTGRTCVPRKTRNCTGGRYYSKKRKLCLCPTSKPYWYNNRCQAGVDDCPGDSVRVGSQCIKENDPAFETRRGGAGTVCPSGTFRVGNNCVQTNLAPLFGKPKKSGQPAAPQGGGQAAPPTNPAKCQGPFTVLGANGKCRQICLTGIWDGKYCQPTCKPPSFAKKGKCFRTRTAPTAPLRACAPGNASRVGNKTVCTCQFNACPSGQVTICQREPCGQGPTKSVRPVPPSIIKGVSGTCPVGVATNLSCRCPAGTVSQKLGAGGRGKATGQICTRTGGGQVKPPPIVKQFRPPAVVKPACVNNQVRLSNGKCGCPSNKPRWSKGRCKKLKGINKFLNQSQQPQNQPQAQQQQQQQKQQLTPKQQQQQQIQQGVDKLIKQFSDARLKRGIEHLVTLENGIRLYSFRYLWDDKAYVGVMAQDLLENQAWRDAVSLTPSGYYLVDYGALGLRMMTLEHWRSRASRGSGASRAAVDLRSN